MDGDTQSDQITPGVGRWAGAITVFGACHFYAWLASFAFGTYYLTDVGVERLQEQAGGLILAIAIGVGGVAAFRALTGKRVTSAWLLIGLVPPVIGTLNHLGIIR